MTAGVWYRHGERVLWHIADHVGSTVALLDELQRPAWPGAGGATAVAYYTAFGERLGPRPAHPLSRPETYFQGKRQLIDRTDAPLFFGARNYAAVLGRFNTPDWGPFDLADPQTLNRYAGMRNDPVNLVDPDGNVAETAWDVANVVMGATSLAANVAAGNVVGAVVDAAGLVVDAAAAATPFVPGGAGAAIRSTRAAKAAARYADDVAEGVAKAANKIRAMAGKADDVVDAGAGVAAASSRSRLAMARRLGKEGEDRVRAAYDIGEKKLIRINGKKRIPDGINDAAQTVSEVKNTAKLGLTKQLRDYLAYAEKKNYTLVIYTRKNTKISSRLQRLIDQGRIKRMYIP